MKNLFKSTACSLVLFASSAFAYGGGNEVTRQNLRWRAGTVNVAISSSLFQNNPNIKYNSDIAGAISRSIETWQRIVGLELRNSASEKQSVSPSGLRGDGVSLITIAQTPANLGLFPKGADDAAATTRVFFDRRRFVTEADIVLNPYQQFSTDGTFGTFDLESTLTHEIGHLLGLEHSNVLGATMYEKYGKNGVLPNFGARTLSQTDISEARALYGNASEDDTCCGKISGKLLNLGARPWQVWAEDPETGRVIGETWTLKDGMFRFEGLPTQSLRLYGQDSAAGNTSSRGELGEVKVTSDETAVIRKRPISVKNEFELEFLGLNGQLSDIAISLQPGNTYTVFLGGMALDPSRISAGVTSPFLGVEHDSIRTIDYGPDVSVVSLDLRVDEKTPAGEYTIFVEGENGARRYIVGGITVERPAAAAKRL